MKVHEEEHSEYFEKEINKRNIKPTRFLKVWDLLGIGLGFGSTLLVKKQLCFALLQLRKLLINIIKIKLIKLVMMKLNLKKNY